MTDESTSTLAPSRRPATGPYGNRLLHGWFASGRPDGRREHLERYGACPRGGPAVLRDVETSGLTGRGGAGFPTGRKMRTVARGRRRAVVIANGMGSEPAARKDSTLMELAPHLVLDGAVVAAESVGADTVHLCLPRTRGDLVATLEAAVHERDDRVAVRVHALPHHYVSSEETALVSWLNGGQAKPMSVPPRPFEAGVGGRPTLVDNVVTLAHVALIARYGPEWFRSTGRHDAPGTALLTLSGAIRTPGVYEAAMGSTIGSLLERAGGPLGAPGAVLLGGFFGSWLPATEVLDVPYAAADLAGIGAGPGAGVICVVPRDACGLAETAAVLGFLAGQSARQCGPCFLGLPAVAEDFARLAHTGTNQESVERLERRVGLLAGRGACRHPDGAGRLAASALRVFADDVRHHQRFGPCPHAHGPSFVDVPAVEVPSDEEWR
ncbi:NADH-ubiquinone oxidoreductase-F iron-sulfur binding region domain-containing protein [Streptomyces sp. ICBB 8177]|uniref:NADH-ubiquinone oxidoreductase-F iron-sulfur binding region domain-containing protein n=1 Tax=Streptomyces sp. ICBB 8177 TaxID=563922 RepID=UPI00130545B0|nr:NADH-ubiquinone oxidoreductase-F iron-sulfur binding region domain-containing protein [Streptomyces sp. ICBB 8177]